MQIFLYIILILFFATAVYLFVAEGSFLQEKDVAFGVTFSPFMARQLGLEAKVVWEAIIKDLGVKKVRLPVYWSEIEEVEGSFDFADYDYFVKTAEDAKVELILNVGRKLPRWPECHMPPWAAGLSKDVFQAVVESQIREVILRYRGSPAVTAWQIENEHFHVYGVDCASGKIPAEYVDAEIALVRSLDSRPIVLTDAGKAGSWFTSLRRAEVLGVTMYYQVWNPWRGVVWSTFGPGLYRAKRNILRAFYPDKKFIVAELQAEPFGPTLLPDYALELQNNLMNVERFRENIAKARRAGFAENYLWGAEWWYWLAVKQGDAALWEEAKKSF